MEQETHLLSDEEWDVLKVYRGLDCKFSMVRHAITFLCSCMKT